ncbi:MAG: acyl-ACP--UDP-N-acetylglucosamine O-acyltransferase [Candidatus Omnitrophota bacterium]
MVKIHPTAIVSKKAELDDVEIGPYAIIDDDVQLGKGTKVMAYAYIASGTRVGRNCEVHMGAILGHIPQHLEFKGAKSYLKIGDRNIFREYSTVHRGLKENSSTIIGDDNYFMGFSHVAHDCQVGNGVVMCNGVLLGGHVSVEDKVFIGGSAAIHQFIKIGTLAMIGGLTRVVKDVPPYMLIEGDSEVCSLNIVGLKRSNIKEEAKAQIKQAYKLLYRSDLNVSQALDAIKKIGDLTEEVKHIIEFIMSSERGICKHRKTAL